MEEGADTAVGAGAVAEGVEATAAEAGAAEIAATAGIAGKSTSSLKARHPCPAGTLSFPSENSTWQVCAKRRSLPDSLRRSKRVQCIGRAATRELVRAAMQNSRL